MDPNREFQTGADVEHQIPAHLPNSNGSLISKIIIPLAIIIAGGLIAWAIYSSPTSNSPKDSVQGAVAGAIKGGVQQTPKYVAVNKTDHILGDIDSKIILIEYSDTECPFCKTYHETLHKIVDEFGKDKQFAWVYRHFPIDKHKKAHRESEATECAALVGGEDAFWKYTDEVYKQTKSNDSLDPAQLYAIAKTVNVDEKLFADCLDGGKMADKVSEQYKEALEAGARGTPYSILYFKGEYIPLVNEKGESLGALPYVYMKSIISDLLSK